MRYACWLSWTTKTAFVFGLASIALYIRAAYTGQLFSHPVLQRQTLTSTVTRSSRPSPTIRTHGAWQADTNCGSLGDQNHVGQKLTGSPLWVVWMVSYIIGTGSVHEGQQGLEYIMRWCGQAGLGVLLRGPDAHLLTSP